MSNFVLYLPDLICLYRALSSILALFLGKHSAAPILFTSALISDLFDGWIFRNHVQPHPDWHPWNRSLVSTDQFGDLTLVVCGIIYTSRYVFRLPLFTIVTTVIIIGLFGFFLIIIPEITPDPIPAIYTLCITTLTHLACLLMITPTIAAWYVTSPYWLIGSIGSIGIFYMIFARIGDASRLVRLPPSDWRKKPKQ